MEPDILTDAELEQLITEGFLEETVKINEKLIVTFRTLDQKTCEFFFQQLNLTEKNTLTAQLVEKNKIYIIASYIYKINNRIFDTPEEKEKLIKILQKGNIVLINKIFEHCLNFINKQTDVIKKN